MSKTETHWGVQLGDDGSMDFYDTEEEARDDARGRPLWKITCEPLSGEGHVPR